MKTHEQYKRLIARLRALAGHSPSGNIYGEAADALDRQWAAILHLCHAIDKLALDRPPEEWTEELWKARDTLKQ